MELVRRRRATTLSAHCVLRVLRDRHLIGTIEEIREVLEVM